VLDDRMGSGKVYRLHGIYGVFVVDNIGLKLASVWNYGECIFT
jgi:hypothetical protein